MAGNISDNSCSQMLEPRQLIPEVYIYSGVLQTDSINAACSSLRCPGDRIALPRYGRNPFSRY